MAGEQDREMARKLIIDQMKAQGFRKDLEVTQLYLAESGLSDVCELTQYRDLQELWLHGNMLRRISFIPTNYRISHLYLQDNELVDICGAIAHLTNLQVLMLQSNQLTRLEATIKEFRAMQALHTLNLSNNPLAQESEYRYYTIHYIPSLQLLDRAEVEKSDRESAAKIYKQTRQSVKDAIAFGRRWEQGKPDAPLMSSQVPGTATTHISDKPVADHFQTAPKATPEEAIAERTLKRSVMQYSHFDWSKVPKAEEKRQQEAATSEKSQIVTVRFR